MHEEWTIRGRIEGPIEDFPRMADEDDRERVTRFLLAVEGEAPGPVVAVECECSWAEEVEDVATDGDRVEIVGVWTGTAAVNIKTPDEVGYPLMNASQLTRLD